ncbi:MAG TPA: heme A synthase, partial [Burkholderiaceae bacterium]
GRRQAGLLAALVGMQWATGLSNVVLGWPLAAALLHTAGAAGMVVFVGRAAASALHGGKSRKPS